MTSASRPASPGTDVPSRNRSAPLELCLPVYGAQRPMDDSDSPSTTVAPIIPTGGRSHVRSWRLCPPPPSGAVVRRTVLTVLTLLGVCFAVPTPLAQADSSNAIGMSGFADLVVDQAHGHVF